MVRKIGNAFLALMFMMSCHAQDTTVALDVLNQHGRPITEIGVGVPFLIEATISGNEQTSAPAIDRIKLVHIEDQGLVSTIKTTINGVSSNKKVYRYVVRADKLGTFTIGPARIRTSAGEIRSHAISISVVAAPKAINEDEAVVRLYCDKENVYVGQKVSFSVRFYYQKGVSLIGISEPQVPGAQPLQGPFSGVDVIDGQRMNYLEWRSSYFPTTVGTLTIPAVRAAYKIPRTQQVHAFDFISSFFDAGFEQKYVYSNGLSLSVNPLPDNQDQVTAIGSFDNFQLLLDRTNARKGDGIVLSLSVEGDGNFDTMQTPSLMIPEGLTYYDSKSTIQELGNNRYKKTWEYIVQGTRAGTIVIPSQTFTYFDVVSAEYKKLKTKPVSLTITAQENADKQTSVDQATVAPKQTIKNEQVNVALSTSTVPLMLNGTINEYQSWQIQWLIFWLCCLAAGIFVAAAATISWYKRYCMVNATQNEHAAAFKRARKELAQAKKNGLTKRELYDIFMRLFAKRASCTINEMTEERMIEQLTKGGCPPHLITQWEEFFRKCCEYAFFIQDKQSNNLNEQAEQWLIRLHDYL
jgi:hypothetical protein